MKKNRDIQENPEFDSQVNDNLGNYSYLPVEYDAVPCGDSFIFFPVQLQLETWNSREALSSKSLRIYKRKYNT